MRLWVMVRDDNALLRERLPAYRFDGLGHGFLSVRAIKRQIDGALGSRGAWLLAPYSDDPSTSGLNTEPVADIEETARIAIENGFQLCVHAIGDRANRETLDLFERAFRAHPAKKDLRWRIEHAQHLSPSDVPRFAQLGVIASMQGIHCVSDGSWVPARIGASRAEEGAYLWRTLIDSGAIVCNGTDVPVEDVDPIASFRASVTRTMADGSVFYPGQRMTRLEALRSYTVNAAYAGFEEPIKGSLAVGKLADVTVLTRDILTIPEGEIAGAKVAYTIVGGKVVYRAE
jgi:predicted amidohydrolase YtcJ